MRCNDILRYFVHGFHKRSEYKILCDVHNSSARKMLEEYERVINDCEGDYKGVVNLMAALIPAMPQEKPNTFEMIIKCFLKKNVDFDSLVEMLCNSFPLYRIQVLETIFYILLDDCETYRGEDFETLLEHMADNDYIEMLQGGNGYFREFLSENLEFIFENVLTHGILWLLEMRFDISYETLEAIVVKVMNRLIFEEGVDTFEAGEYWNECYKIPKAYDIIEKGRNF